MSIKILNQAWEIPVGDPTRKLVLMCLADHANEDDRTCWPAIDTIARKCEVGARTVQRHIKELEKTGFILRRSRTGDSTLYFVLPYRATEDEIDRMKRRGVKMTGVSPMTQGGDTHDRGGVTPMTPKPSKNHQLTVNSSSLRSELALDGFDEFWNAYGYKKARPKCEEIWRRKKLARIKGEVIAGAKKYAEARGPNRKFWKYPQGWLNDGRWTDELTQSNGRMDGYMQIINALPSSKGDEDGNQGSRDRDYENAGGVPRLGGPTD